VSLNCASHLQNALFLKRMGVWGAKVMTDDEKLGHSLKLYFGLALYEPAVSQLSNIQGASQYIKDRGRRPTNSDG
jgi:hypothetical protein